MGSKTRFVVFIIRIINSVMQIPGDTPDIGEGAEPPIESSPDNRGDLIEIGGERYFGDFPAGFGDEMGGVA